MKKRRLIEISKLSENTKPFDSKKKTKIQTQNPTANTGSSSNSTLTSLNIFYVPVL
jgi:hypothetical protein